MPELPEVETVKETLKKKILNKTIYDINIYWDNIIKYPSKDTFIASIKNQTIHDITRRGKWLVFTLDDYYLLSHLRMEGKYYLKEHNQPREKHEHIIINLGDIELRYHDTRKFGKMYLIKKDEINKKGPLVNLGLDPFVQELTVAYLKDKYKHKKLPIKTILLDQNIITGIGNIYADEILFLSRINPNKAAHKLTKKELQSIIDNTKLVLNKAITMGGTTIRTYTSSLGVSGQFQHELFVHKRQGEPCKICGSTINKTKIGGRGTYYCKHCQR